MTRIGTTNNPQSIGGTADEGIAGEGTAGDPARTSGNAGEGARAPQRGGERLALKQSAGHSPPIVGESRGEVSNECLETGAVGTAMEYLLQASAYLIPTGYAAVRLPMKAIICHYCRTI